MAQQSVTVTNSTPTVTVGPAAASTTGLVTQTGSPLASAAEAMAGIIDTKAVTPASLRAALPFRVIFATGVEATDDVAINSALDEIYALSGGVVWVVGDAAVHQIEVPATVLLTGGYWHGFGTNRARLRHLTAKTVDMIRFEMNAAGFAGPCGVTDLQLVGHASSTAGCGLNTMNAAGSTAILQDASTFARLYIRGFAEDGFLIRGGSPANLDHIATLWNGGYGVRVIDTGGGNPTGRVHHVNMSTISGDGNSGGAAIRFEGIQNMGGITLRGVKSEQRDNLDRGGVDRQPNAIQFDNCAGPVSIDGITHISSALSTTKPGNVIVVSGAAKPDIRWSGAGIRVLASQTVGADPLVLTDGTTTFPRIATHGFYNATKGAVHGDYAGVKPNVTDHYFGVGGTVPGIGLWETDAAADEKLWALVSSAGDFYIRALADSGAAGSNPVVISRTGTVVDAVNLATHLLVLADQTYDLGASGTRWRDLFCRHVRAAGDVEIDGALDHDGTTVGFYGVTPATRPTAYTQTYATADKTHAAFTSADLTGITSSTTGSALAEPGAAYVQAEQQQNFRRIQDQFVALRADVADLKQLVNSVIDDLQTLGILQ